MFANTTPRILAALLMLLALAGCGHVETPTPKGDAPASSSRPGARPVPMVAESGRRLALVVGNGGYPRNDPSFPFLTNPLTDADGMAEMLRGFGFGDGVTVAKDAGKEALEEAVNRFVARIQPGDAAFFYFSGHGTQVETVNYLIPVGAALRDETDVKHFAVSANWVLDKISARRPAVALMVLDSCRTDFETKGFQAKGFSGMAAKGAFVGYAASPGRPAFGDSGGGYSLFTGQLLQAARQAPHAPVEQVFKQARVGVDAATNGRQVPWTSNNLIGDFCFGGCRAAETGASLVLRARPPGARLWLGDKSLGSAGADGLRLDNLPPGRYEVRAELAGYGPASETLNLEAGQRHNLQLALAPLQAQAAIAPPPAPSALPPAVPEPPRTSQPDSAPAPAPVVIEPARMPSAPTAARQPHEPEMVRIPAGCFLMGSPESEPMRDSDEGPQHQVCLPAFELGKYEVTFDQWDACVAAGGCSHKPDDNGWGRGNRPVMRVSWEDAQQLIAWLNRATGGGYRLPSEAEWEYAARAGTTTPFYTGNCIATAQANYDGKNANYNNCGARTGTYLQKTQPVGSYPANPWGLHDMAGTVWEWVEDCWHDSYNGVPIDGSAWKNSCQYDAHAIRGGSWFNDPDGVRSSNRTYGTPGRRGLDVGFRLARTY